MKPARFEYVRPGSLDEALEHLDRYGEDGKLLAGGQSLMPLLNMRMVQPSALIDLNGLRELAYVRRENGHVEIGALTRQRVVETDPVVGETLAVVQGLLSFVGHVTIRNRGTMGGSIAHADPAAELPTAMTTLDATFVVAGRQGARTIPAGDFFQSYLTTALSPGEILTAIRVPVVASSWGWAFEELARRHGDFALAAVLVLVDVGPDRRLRSVRIGVAGAASVPLRVHEVERELVGEAIDERTLALAAEIVARSVDPISDVHASSQYRRDMVAVLARRALGRAAVRALGKGGVT